MEVELAEQEPRVGGVGVAGQEALAVDEGYWSYELLWSRAATIYAGTSEVQRNIIATRVLGLPR